MELEPFRVNGVQFIHGHSLPSEISGAAKPIILRFASYADRKLVLSNAYKLAGSRKRIVNDLPVMKKERNRLSNEAYKIRIQTRIKDKELAVYLQMREINEDTWEKRKVDYIMLGKETVIN